MIRTTQGDMNLPIFDIAPKAIAIDLDGTLLNTKSQVSARNRLAIDSCVSSGLPVIIATARTERSVRRLIGEELANMCSLVMMNGTIARGRAPLSGIIREAMPPEAAADIVALILEMEPSVRITIELDGFEFGCNQHLDAAMLWQTNSATPDMVLSLEETVARTPAKISVSGSGRDLSLLAREITSRFSDSVTVVPSDNMTFLNIPSAKASKPAALRHLLSSQQITLDQVIAFGDDVPDIGMLKECGIPVAMGNAFPEVKAICKYQTAGNDEDGVALALEKMLQTLE